MKKLIALYSKVVRLLIEPFQKQQFRVQLIRRDTCRMTLDEWRSSPECIQMAMKCMSDPHLRMMLDVARNEHLAMSLFSAATIEERAIRQAQCEGYGLALNNIEAMSRYQKPTEHLEATFQDELEENPT